MTRSTTLALATALVMLLVPALADEDNPLNIPVVPPPPPPDNAVVHLGTNHLNCTGFYVGDNEVVTAGHCVKGDLASTFKVVAADGHTFEARVAAFSDYDMGLEDWAILKIKDSVPGSWQGAALDCTGKALKIGTEVRAEGFPGLEGSEYRVTWGRVDGKNSVGAPFSAPMIHTSLAIAPGNSGGPLFRDSDDEVVGIVAAVSIPFTTYSMSQPIAPVCALLHRA